MCLAVPMLIKEIENGTAACQVGDSQTFVKASLALLDGKVGPGDYIIVHAGFALRKLEEADAIDTLKLLREMVQLSGQDCNF